MTEVVLVQPVSRVHEHGDKEQSHLCSQIECYGLLNAGEKPAVQFYNNWKAQVIHEVQAERLLVF